MIHSCTVDIEYFDKKTNRVHTRNVRASATFGMRKINGGFEISVKTGNSNDLFITEKPMIYDKLITDGKITIKIIENRCAVSVRDTVEENIRNLLEVLSQSSPGLIRRQSAPPEKLHNFSHNKENICQEESSNIIKKIDKNNRHNKSSPESKERITLNNNIPNNKLSCTSINLNSPKGPTKILSSNPVKRTIPFGTGTPSKNENGGLSSFSSPQNLRSVRYLICIMITLQFRILLLNHLIRDNVPLCFHHLDPKFRFSFSLFV